MNKPIVSICCQTYNHKNYIKQAIDSFLMQKTNFKFEILLRDDASTDGTQEIVIEYVKKYPDVINPLIYKENQFKNGVSPFRDNVKRAKGKYIALCEGDDYWTDPYKLQKQVDFLEANPEYGMICTDYDIYIDYKDEYIKDYLKMNYHYCAERDIDIEFYIPRRSYIRTLTVCFRNNLRNMYMNEIDDHIKYNSFFGDIQLWLFILTKSKIKYFPDSTGAYRVTQNTASRISDIDKRYRFKSCVSNTLQYFAYKYHLSSKTKKEIRKNQLLTEMEYFFYIGKPIKIFTRIIQLILLGTMSKASLCLLFGSLDKKSKQKVIKKLKLETYLIK